ncbi:MAG TPA: hypothetical protein VMS98_08300 [Thermoanaerobaculia bacterium]|nr:hypothetical protein [Thermoanaerobaculia bacterium]
MSTDLWLCGGFTLFVLAMLALDLGLFLVGRVGDEFDAERGGKLLSLAAALSPARVVFDLKAESIPEAIREMVDRVPRRELRADRAAITRAVLEREQTMSTGRLMGAQLGAPPPVDAPLARRDVGVGPRPSSHRPEPQRQRITNVHVSSPRHWQKVSTTDGSSTPCSATAAE